MNFAFTEQQQAIREGVRGSSSSTTRNSGWYWRVTWRSLRKAVTSVSVSDSTPSLRVT